MAEIRGQGFSGSSSAGAFGNVGMEGHLTIPGTLTTALGISSDEFINATGIPLHAQANFIVDGGRLTFFADGFLLFSLRLNATVFDKDGLVAGGGDWVSTAQFELFAAAPVLTLTGHDLGIVMNDPLSARIPLSFQTFDIGIVPPGGTIEIAYSASIYATVPSGHFAEIIAWQFTDPLSVDGPGEFPIITFEAVPEPASGLLLGVGSLLATLLRRRGSRSTADADQPRQMLGGIC